MIHKEHKRTRRMLKAIILVVLLLVVIPWILAIVPIRFTIRSFDSIRKKEFYIVKYISGSTEGGLCYIIGSQDGMWDDGIGVIIKGKDPKHYVSFDIYDNDNAFIIYGSLTKESSENSEWGYSYTLDSDGWDIFGNVNRRSGSGKINYKRFITVYDLKWLDNFLADEYGYP